MEENSNNINNISRLLNQDGIIKGEISDTDIRIAVLAWLSDDENYQKFLNLKKLLVPQEKTNKIIISQSIGGL